MQFPEATTFSTFLVVFKEIIQLLLLIALAASAEEGLSRHALESNCQT